MFAFNFISTNVPIKPKLEIDLKYIMFDLLVHNYAFFDFLKNLGERCTLIHAPYGVTK